MDDEFVIAKTLSLILNQNGFEARALCEGAKAPAIAHDWPPDILLCDVVLADCDGFEIAAQVCAARPGCRVFILTAQHWPEETVEHYRECTRHFEMLTKPIHPTVLLSRLRSVV